MNKLLLLGVVSLAVLVVVFAGCAKTGQVYVASYDADCVKWKNQCDAGNNRACSYLDRCVDVYTKAEVDTRLNSLIPLSGTYYACYQKGGSTTEFGTNLYLANPEILTNSVEVDCDPGEEALISDFTCNPMTWEQKNPVYVSAVASSFDYIKGVSGRILTCTGGESQGILNIVCCKSGLEGGTGGSGGGSGGGTSSE